jgi:hypothetical protein
VRWRLINARRSEAAASSILHRNVKRGLSEPPKRGDIIAACRTHVDLVASKRSPDILHRPDVGGG